MVSRPSAPDFAAGYGVAASDSVPRAGLGLDDGRQGNSLGPPSSVFVQNIERLVWLQLQCNTTNATSSRPPYQLPAQQTSTTLTPLFDDGIGAVDGGAPAYGVSAHGYAPQTSIETGTVSGDVATSESTPNIPLSVGSMGHPDACSQPCKYYKKPRGCRDGLACSHCHICPWHPGRRSRRRGRNEVRAHESAAAPVIADADRGESTDRTEWVPPSDATPQRLPLPDPERPQQYGRSEHWA